MAKNWNDLRERLTPESRARADHKTEVMLVAMALREILLDRGFTQQELAQQLDVAQGNVSRTLRRTDMHVSTPREIIEAMGGSLEITANFPDRKYRIESLAPQGL